MKPHCQTCTCFTRSTGKRSANTHIHGHAQLIAEHTGDWKSEVIRQAADLAVGRGKLRMSDKGRPLPEPKWTPGEAGAVIEALHDIAGLLDVRLKEYDYA